jgi:peptidoglycan/xylan/chitin deacetylase (PgdA/CDA1 family)
MNRDVTIVLYHHISERESGLTNQLGLSTKPDVFEKHIKYFSKNYDFVSPTDLLEGHLPRKSLIVTFDDAYRSVLDIACPTLRAVGAPSLFFVNPTTLMSDVVPIDNILSYVLDELGLDAVLSLLDVPAGQVTSIAQLFGKIVSQMNNADVHAAKLRLLSAIGTEEGALRQSSQLFLEQKDIESLLKYDVEIGNHSMSHIFFRSLSPDELKEEICGSRAILKRLTSKPIHYLSIPYGNEIDATSEVLEIARGCGHRAIFLAHAKSNMFWRQQDVYFRISMGNSPPETLGLKLRLMPVLRSIRDMVSVWN